MREDTFTDLVHHSCFQPDLSHKSKHKLRPPLPDLTDTIFPTNKYFRTSILSHGGGPLKSYCWTCSTRLPTPAGAKRCRTWHCSSRLWENNDVGNKVVSLANQVDQLNVCVSCVQRKRWQNDYPLCANMPGRQTGTRNMFSTMYMERHTSYAYARLYIKVPVRVWIFPWMLSRWTKHDFIRIVLVLSL